MQTEPMFGTQSVNSPPARKKRERKADEPIEQKKTRIENAAHKSPKKDAKEKAEAKSETSKSEPRKKASAKKTAKKPPRKNGLLKTLDRWLADASKKKDPVPSPVGLGYVTMLATGSNFFAVKYGLPQDLQSQEKQGLALALQADCVLLPKIRELAEDWELDTVISPEVALIVSSLIFVLSPLLAPIKAMFDFMMQSMHEEPKQKQPPKQQQPQTPAQDENTQSGGEIVIIMPAKNG